MGHVVVDGGGVPARLQLAALPSTQPLPDTVDPDAFRAAVLEAWTNRPLEDRPEALDRLLDRVTLSPGGVKITHGDCHQEPPGPP